MNLDELQALCGSTGDGGRVQGLKAKRVDVVALLGMTAAGTLVRTRIQNSERRRQIVPRWLRLPIREHLTLGEDLETSSL